MYLSQNFLSQISLSQIVGQKCNSLQSLFQLLSLCQTEMMYENENPGLDETMFEEGDEGGR